MIDRRTMLFLLGGTLVQPAYGQTRANTGAMTRITAYAFSFPGSDGRDIRLSEYAGRPILVVNTASLCGYTPQYNGLQQLWTRYQDQGLMIIGVPSNDFGNQEPGDTAAILKTAHEHYGTSFPLAAKTNVRGEGLHGFYKWAAAERPLDTPRWNFHKYLIGRDGRIAAVFPSAIEPMDARILAAIAKELPRSP